jgi:hypothetical protein
MKSQSQLLTVKNQAALEMIEFQDDSLHKELTALYEAMKKLDTKAMAASKEAIAIEDLLFKRTGIKVKFTMDDGGAYCLPPTVDKNNPLIHNVYREWYTNAPSLKMIEKAGGAIRGSVNLAKSTVTGVFSEMECLVNMSDWWVSGKFAGGGFTPAELSAITLHELGHLFTGFEYLWHSVTTNQVLAGVAKGLDESTDVGDRELVLISAARALNLDETAMKELAQSAGGKTATVVIIQEITKNARSEIGSELYDFNNWEQLADQFAARHGAQRDLITSLDKVHHLVGDISVRSTGMYVMLESVKVLMLLGTLWMAVTPLVGAILVPIFFLWAWICADGPGDPIYDRPGVRLKRIRDQLVEQLKDRDLAKELAVRIKEDIVAVDKLLTTVKDRFQLFDILGNFLSGEKRNRLKQEKLQQELETLAANDLFVKSAELKALF